MSEWPLGDAAPLQELLSAAADAVEAGSVLLVLDLGGDALMAGPKVSLPSCAPCWLIAAAACTHYIATRAHQYLC